MCRNCVFLSPGTTAELQQLLKDFKNKFQEQQRTLKEVLITKNYYNKSSQHFLYTYTGTVSLMLWAYIRKVSYVVDMFYCINICRNVSFL